MEGLYHHLVNAGRTAGGPYKRCKNENNQHLKVSSQHSSFIESLPLGFHLLDAGRTGWE